MLQTSLRRFQEVVRCGSIRAAADRLFVTPSALSRELQKLEEELGVILFERRSRGMALTAEGMVYLNHVRDVLNGEARMRSELDALQNLHRGQVQLLTVEGYASHYLAPAVAQFQQRYPHIRFLLRITHAAAVVAGIASGEADIGLIFNASQHEEMRSVLHLNVPLVAAMAPDHPLARRRSLSLEQLSNYRIALQDDSFAVRRIIDLQCELSKIHLSPVLETNSLAVLRSFARNAGGVTLLSQMSISSELKHGELVAIPLDEPLLCRGSVDVCVLADRKLPVAATAFLEHLTESQLRSGS